MTYYERNLPHWHPEGASVFVTWTLHGAYDKFRNSGLRNAAPGKAFAELDKCLDQASVGPTWLKIPEIAQCVEDAIQFGDRQLLYTLIAYLVMSNHVHIVIQPKTTLPRITKSIKGFTARKCNELLGRTGEKFWQDESYDHWARTGRELQKIIAYVERNPVRAGLVGSIEDWLWSSASTKYNTGKNACATQ